MIDIEKHIAYWHSGSGEDWQVACELVESGHARHGLYFAHLALEKMLKAHVCRATGDLAPRIHNLVRLAELAGLATSETQRTFLARMNQYQLEGRYPGTVGDPIEAREAKAVLGEVKEMLEWLTSQL